MRNFIDELRVLIGQEIINLGHMLMPRGHPATEVWSKNILYAALEIVQDAK